VIGRNNKILGIALTKGRLENETVNMFEKMGMDVNELRNKGRRLILPISNEEGPPGDGIGQRCGIVAEVILAKAPDVITYVEHGVCDIGIVGKDVIMEHGGRYFEIFDLGFGRCRFSLAGKKGENFYKGHGIKTVATKYPGVARSYFESKGQDVDIIKIEGSVELAPLLNLADGIVDIVETGETLKENGLEVFEEIAEVSARIIVNSVSMKLRKTEIEKFVAGIERVGKA
jgi:ATP phosphoribosyltransferase